MEGNGAMEVDKAGPEGLMHNPIAWICWLYTLFGVVWYTLDFLEVTYLVNRSWLPLCFASIGLGLFLFNAIWYYAKQVPFVGAKLSSGVVEAETIVDVRVAKTDRVFLIAGLILYSVWFAIALTVYIRVDGRGEGAVDYLVADPAADANLTTLDILGIRRHNNLMLAGFFVSIILFIFGSIAWEIGAQNMVLYQMSGGNNRRGYAPNYQMAGTAALNAIQMQPLNNKQGYATA